MQNQNQSNEKQYQKAVSSIEKLIAKIKPQTSSSMKSCIVGLYTADDDNPMRFSGKIGLLELDIDRALKTHFLRFYDIQNLHLLLEVQMFYGFSQNYRKIQGEQNFYIFDFFEDGIIGFLFRNETEALLFQTKIKTASPKIEQFRELQKQKIRQQIQQKKSQSFFGKLKKKFKDLTGQEQHEDEKKQSVVLNVQKQKSIVMNLETGDFDLQNIPPEWQEIFENMGLLKEDMKSKEIMQFVFEETLIHQIKKAAEENPDVMDHKHLQMIRQFDRETFNQSESQVKVKSNPIVSEEIIVNHQNKQQNITNINLLPPPPPPPSLNIQNKGNTNLLPPPPPPPSPPPPTSLGIGPSNNANSVKPDRTNLMAQIRNNQIKLKPVKTNQKGELEIDASSMNKQERRDLAEHIRLKLQRRKQALRRRDGSDSQNDSD